MHKAKRMTKKKKIFFLFLVILIVVLIIIGKNKNYEITYQIDNATITEKYNQEKHIYQFVIISHEKEFATQFLRKKVRGKKLITKIEVKEDENSLCIIPNGKKFDYYPLCYQKDQLISYQQIDNKELLNQKYFRDISPTKSEYNQVQINYLNNKTYYIWNYKGFFKINNENKESISIFSKDTYTIPLSYKTNDSIILANYDDNYNFDTFYLLQVKNNKVKKITNNKELSFDSYFLGSYKNKVYFVDKKNKKEYEINTKKLSINDITHNNKGKIWTENDWEKISMNKLSSTEYSFSKDYVYNYQIIDNQLYLLINDYKILISHLPVKSIVEADEETVYYLVDDQLYYYNHTDGEVLIMSYFEWNFNYKNMIYIF